MSVVAASHRGPFGLVPYVLLAANGTAVGPNPYRIPITAAERRVASGSIDDYYGDQQINGVHARVYAEGVQGGGAIVVAASLQATDRALSRIRFWIFLIGGIGIALAAGVAALVAAAALRPIRRLTAAAESVAATGSLAERVEVSGDDELGRLATRFNEMLEALERSVGAQRRLVADASHELRTPLTAVRTNLDLLREGKLPADEAQRALEESSVELDGLTTLVADLVELARGEERKLRIEDVHLDDLVATVVERAKARAPQMTFLTSLAPAQVQRRPGAARAGDLEPDRQRREVEPGRRPRRDHRARRRGRRDGSRPRDRRGGSAAHLRPLLPGRDRALEARRGARARDRPRGGDGARRHRDGRERRHRRPVPAVAAGRGLSPTRLRRRRARRPRSASCRP